jgi:regulator of sigma E protease
LLPFGAFVKIYGEEGEIDDERSFSRKPIWQRLLIVLGGVVSFWIVAFILLTVIMSLGVPTVVSDTEEDSLLNTKVQVSSVSPRSPAELAGIRLGDTITSIRAKEGGEILSVTKVKEVQEFVEKYKGREIVLTLKRGKDSFEAILIPRTSPPPGEGAMGVSLVRSTIKSYPWPLAIFKGAEATVTLTWNIITGLFQILGNLFSGKGIPKGVELMGPVGIVTLTAQISQLGISHFLYFIALLAIYLAVFNLLPLPALDGGKIIFLAIEAVRKKPLPLKVEQSITAFFFTLLVILMILVTIRDIAKFF